VRHIWIIVIGFVGGIIARFNSPGPNRQTGFILTTGLGIAGAFVATFIGQTIGWYRLDQGAGLIGAIVGAVPGAPPLAVGIVRGPQRPRRLLHGDRCQAVPPFIATVHALHAPSRG
jgi:uncharacterized membrane protein YeaQ/YmgE (transglycosylase-associated protein family)